jgi:hypothetical protein
MTNLPLFFYKKSRLKNIISITKGKRNFVYLAYSNLHICPKIFTYNNLYKSRIINKDI